MRTGTVPHDPARLYETLFDNRLKGDYADLVRFQQEEVAPWLDEAARLVALLARQAERPE